MNIVNAVPLSVSFSFSRLTALPCEWQQISQERCQICTRLYDITSQSAVFCIMYEILLVHAN